MRIACDVCGTAPAEVICCADEATLCARCDEAVHAANKLAGKHRRLPLLSAAAKFPRCDICQEKPAFIFCVDDRALFCQDCDEAIHIPSTRSANHQRLLATGIRVGSSPKQNTNTVNPRPKLPSSNPPIQAPKLPDKIQTPSPSILSPWEVDNFLHLSDHEPCDKETLVGFGELLWFSDIGAAEVPEMFFQQPSYEALNSSPSSKKPRIQMLDDDDFFTVPDLGVPSIIL